MVAVSAPGRRGPAPEEAGESTAQAHNQGRFPPAHRGRAAEHGSMSTLRAFAIEAEVAAELRVRDDAGRPPRTVTDTEGDSP